MFDVKSGTKTWSDNPEVNFKRDKTQTMSAKEREKLLGDKELGEHLNTIADPNWIDPAKMRGVGNSELDKDAFLKLFLAQLKNQDPMNPMESHELAAQLAQFTSLEKLNNIDTGIGQLAKAKNPKSSFEALNMIGKVVSTDSSRIIRSDEGEKHNIEFNLLKTAEKANIEIKDANGLVVRKLDAIELNKGLNKVQWDGRSENGTAVQPGEYKVVIEARGSKGEKVGAETSYEGKVTGVNYTAQGPVLMIGDQSIRLSEVKKIVDPSINAQERLAHEAKAVDAKSDPEAKGQTAAASVGMGGNLENVGMSQGLINNIQKESKGGL